jgi:hypothetical protein
LSAELGFAPDLDGAAPSAEVGKREKSDAGKRTADDAAVEGVVDV